MKKKTKDNAIYLHITKFFFLQNPHFCLLMWQCQNMILRTSRLHHNSVDPVSQKEKHFWISFWLLHPSNVSDFSWPQERYTILNEENRPRFKSEIKHCLITIILHTVVLSILSLSVILYYWYSIKFTIERKSNLCCLSSKNLCTFMQKTFQEFL